MKERSRITCHQLTIQKQQSKQDTPNIHSIGKYAKTINKGLVDVGTESFEERTVRKGMPTAVKMIDTVYTKNKMTNTQEFHVANVN